MALTSSMVWEVRSTGSDLNGGGFDAGLRATGTDYSQQDAPKAVYADLVIDSANAALVTSASRPFVAGDAGNTLRIPAGIVGFTAGVYCIRSVSGGAATLDRGCGTTGTSQASGSVRLGGAIASLGRLAQDMVASNVAFVKSGSYSEAGVVTFPQSVTPSESVPPSRIIGYSAARSDWGTLPPSRPAITVAGSGYGLSFTGNGWSVANLSVAGSGLTNGIRAANQYCALLNLKVSGVPGWGISNNASVGLTAFCEVTGCVANFGRGIYGNALVVDCHVHDNSGTLFTGIEGHGVVLRCVVANNSGYGILLTNGSAIANTVHNNGGGGIYLSSCQGIDFLSILGNILSNNAGYGILDTYQGFPAWWTIDGNAYWGNTQGSLGNIGDSGATNAVNSVLGYAFGKNQALTGSPCVGAATGDYRLNSTAGAGAACRGTGPLGSWPGLSIAGAADLGAVQGSSATTAPPTGSVQGHGNFYF